MSEERIKILLVGCGEKTARLVKRSLARDSTIAVDLMRKASLDEESFDLVRKGLVNVILLSLPLKAGFSRDVANLIRTEGAKVPIILLARSREDLPPPEDIKKEVMDCLIESELKSGLLPRVVKYAVRQYRLVAPLQELETRYRALIEDINEVIFTVNDEGRIAFISPVVEKITHYKVSELVGRHFSEFVYPSDLDHLVAVFKKAVHGRGARAEFRALDKDGSLLHVRISGRIMRQKGKFAGINGILVDVTEHRLIEEKLRKERDFSRSLISASPAFFVAIDADGRTMMMNDAMLNALGYTADEVVGKDYLTNFVPEYDREGLSKVFKKLTVSKEPTVNENHVLTKDGKELLVEWHGRPVLKEDGDFDYLFGMGIDITERRKAENELKRINRQLSALLKIAAGLETWREPEELAKGIVRALAEGLGYHLVGIFLLVNDVLKIVAGAGYQEEGIAKLFEFPLDRGIVGRVARTKKAAFIPDVKKDKDYVGPTDIRSEICCPLLLRGNELMGVLDIESKTELTDEDFSVARAAAQLVATALGNAQLFSRMRRQKEQLEALRRVTEDLAALRDLDALLRLIVERAIKLLGGSAGTIHLRRPDKEVLECVVTVGKGTAPKGTLLEKGEGVSGKIWASGKPIIINNYQDWPRKSPQLAKFPIRVFVGVPIRWGTDFLGVLNVHTPQKGRHFSKEDADLLSQFAACAAIAINNSRLYEQVQSYAAELEQRVEERTAELQRINEELEAFTYSVSHDLRSPLRAMQGLAQVLLEDHATKLDPLGREYAERIVSAAQRMDALIRDLLSYSRLGRIDLHLEPVELNMVVEKVLAQLEKEINESRAVVSIDRPLPAVTGHSTTLIQVVANLVENAIKFVAKGTKPKVRIYAEKKEEWVRLWVEDNGIGIAPEDRQRIFRVFERLHSIETYSGTGIGLAIVCKGMERMGGRVGVESAPGKGSRFWIELPEVRSKQ